MQILAQLGFVLYLRLGKHVLGFHLFKKVNHVSIFTFKKVCGECRASCFGVVTLQLSVVGELLTQECLRYKCLHLLKLLIVLLVHLILGEVPDVYRQAYDIVFLDLAEPGLLCFIASNLLIEQLGTKELRKGAVP